MKTINLSDIKITKAFIDTVPNPDKVKKYKDYYIKNQIQEKAIVIDNNNYLQDGYIQYLILKECGATKATIIRVKNHKSVKNNNINRSFPKYKTNRTTYIFGVHPNDNFSMERVWRVPNTWNGWEEDLSIGDTIVVHTKHGKAPLIITKIETLDKPPIKDIIKRVCYKCKK